ncbi:MAG: pyridoxine 5'-phosphate synthase [Planctomycetaceae bacterium]|jgi:pyridoxine 5-phosphate synthase|nr:pyridoxine 5'-phosphate synthase [Planctomycetaceae bacterium]
MIELGVNIDHIATLRQARRTVEPDPVWGAVLAELGGADGITVHLREDRRHINDRDVKLLRETVRCKLNLEMAAVDEIAKIALNIKPDQATLVPERREEITTEGGLNITNQKDKIKNIVQQLQNNGISVSLFLDPDLTQIEAGIQTGCEAIEIHTGSYALTKNKIDEDNEIKRIIKASRLITNAGLRLHAGHGLNYHNVVRIANIPKMKELNIGHSIIARSIMVGIKEAVNEMKKIINPQNIHQTEDVF